MTEEIKKKKVTLQPHLALTHNELQGGASNGRNVSLLMKADADITDEQKELLKSLIGDVEAIEKMSNNSLRNKMNDAIKAFSRERWDWSYVEDFDETIVVFSNSDGLYSTGYSISNNQVVLDTVANPVNRIISYEEATGKIILSEADDGVDANVLMIVKKSFDSISSNEKLKGVYKSKLEKGKQLMEQEIVKAVEAAVAPVQQQLEKATASLTEATQSLEKANAENAQLKEKLEAVEKAEKEAKEAQRLELIKSVVSDEAKVASLQKSLAVLDDEAFAEVIKGFADKNDVIEGSELFVQKSGSGTETGEAESQLMKLLKEQYASK